MFKDMGLLEERESSEFTSASELWLAQLMVTGDYIGWLIEHDGLVVAGAGVLMREQGPSPGCPRTAKWAHIVNVYTERQYRRQGLARRLIETILKWSQVNDIVHMTLGTSSDGRLLYESLGFRPTADMKLVGSARI